MVLLQRAQVIVHQATNETTTKKKKKGKDNSVGGRLPCVCDTRRNRVHDNRENQRGRATASACGQMSGGWNPVTTLTHRAPPQMAWALYLSAASSSSVTDDQLAELDDYELASRAGPSTRAEHLSRRIGHIVFALVCAAGALNSRQQMLRAVSLLQALLSSADPPLLASAAQGLVSAYCAHANNDRPDFLAPLVSIAVDRVSDEQLSATAAHSLCILLGCPVFEPALDKHIPADVCEQVHVQTRKVIAMLITEVMLTASPPALAALSQLLRRDSARLAFCEKDGVSSLAAVLQTQPGHIHTAIGELVATSTRDGRGVGASDPVYASYHAVFSVWMLTFASCDKVLQTVLDKFVSSRLVVVLARLLNHSSEQSFKIARVTLASLCNMAVGSSHLHERIRRDLLAAHAPAVLKRLLGMASASGSFMGTDEDVVANATQLLAVLDDERASMSTRDSYVAELNARALHWSPLHKDAAFWIDNSHALLSHSPGVVHSLAAIVMDGEAEDLQRVVAVSDISKLVRACPPARRAFLAVPGLKAFLMELMLVADEPELKSGALLCVQLLLLHRSGALG